MQKLNKAEKITIILTTHYMEEADYLCERVAIIDHGRILAMGTPAGLKNSMGGDVITLKVNDAAKMASLAKSVKGAAHIKLHDNSVSVAMANAGNKIPELLKLAERSGIAVESVDLHKPTLEDVFIRYTGEKIRDHEASAGDRFRERMRARLGRR